MAADITSATFAAAGSPCSFAVAMKAMTLPATSSRSRDGAFIESGPNGGINIAVLE